MNTSPRTLGNHAWFFRSGDAYTVPSAGTSGQEAKPGATDTGWIDLGAIEGVQFEPVGDEKEVWKPAPGTLRLFDIIENKRGLNITIKTKEIGPHTFELMLGTLPLGTASTQYNPLEGTTKKGWLKVQQYDQADALVNTLDVFVHIKIPSAVDMGEDIVSPDLKGRVLHSTLNTGTLVAS